jgi:cytochrome d ubiquinol oxidase subunit I
VAPVFFAFRVMVGLGVLMLLLTIASLWAWRRGTLERARWLLDAWRWMSASGFVALLAGWYVVEIGRQPYVVYGLLRTSEAVSPNIVAAAVMASLIVYACAYAVIFGAGVWYIRKLMLVGPVRQPPKDTQGGEKTPARPMSLPDETVDGAGGQP